jgi:MurE/MurF fusion protein
MQRLQTPSAAALWLKSRLTGALHTDSRRVQPGDGFIAWPGYATDGRRYVGAALQAGAAACVVEADGAQAFGFSADERVAALPGLKAATGPIADAWFGSPSSSLQVVASTGTNGKTSTAWWTAQMLGALGRRCGVIGTLGVGEPGQVEHTGLTTPDPITLHGTLRRFLDAGFAACALEASSIGLVEHRLDALKIDVALFTNFTQDHLDYHGSMAAYWAAKRALFAWPGLRAAAINIDDEHGAALAAELQGGALDVWAVSLHGTARLRAEALRYEGAGLVFDAVEGAHRATVRTALVGEFNANNLLVVIAGLRALGVPLADAARAASHASPVPGRLQQLQRAGLVVVVDYAHTPDALEKVIAALRPLAGARGGALWCVFGCGGNRDATKRPLMGAIAARGADRVVVTSDNPRDEPPASILAQIAAGIEGGTADVIEDRRAAIRHAVRLASAGDVILVAGKGHEDYQEIAGVKRPFSDLAEAEAALAEREGAAA